uniref:Uncharacterized protein n=1 Tax=Oryza meridionalis TaxID=40149 RepID=A0A0E0E0Q7_9ORYZ
MSSSSPQNVVRFVVLVSSSPEIFNLPFTSNTPTSRRLQSTGLTGCCSIVNVHRLLVSKGLIRHFHLNSRYMGFPQIVIASLLRQAQYGPIGVCVHFTLQLTKPCHFSRFESYLLVPWKVLDTNNP